MGGADKVCNESSKPAVVDSRFALEQEIDSRAIEGFDGRMSSHECFLKFEQPDTENMTVLREIAHHRRIHEFAWYLALALPREHAESKTPPLTEAHNPEKLNGIRFELLRGGANVGLNV